MRKLPTRGWGPWRQEWYSFHSSPEKQFAAGSWENVWIRKLSSFIFKHAPAFWVCWVNLPPIRRRTLKKLRKHFPNMR